MTLAVRLRTELVELWVAGVGVAGDQVMVGG